MLNAIKWNSKIQFPSDSQFKNRIIGCEFKNSKNSGNPMLEFKLEVVAPETYDVAGELVNIAGVQASFWRVTGNPNDAVKDKNFKSDTEKLLKSLGYPMAELNWDNIDTKPVLGKLVYCEMSSQINEMHKTPTTEEVAKAKTNETDIRLAGAIQINPMTGEKRVKYFPQIKEIFGLVPGDAGVSMAY